MKTKIWLFHTYTEEKHSLVQYYIACAVDILVTSLFAYSAKPILHLESDALIVSITRMIDLPLFWTVFISLLIIKDRKILGRTFTPKERKEKIIEYGSMSILVELFYIIIAWVVQYFMQVKGMNPGNANLIIILVAIIVFSVILPPLKFSLKNMSKKVITK